MEGMLGDQERDFIDNYTQDEVLTTRTYSKPGSEYFGELRVTASQQGLNLIAREHRYALKAIPRRCAPWPEPIGDCGEDCFRILANGDPLPPHNLQQIVIGQVPNEVGCPPAMSSAGVCFAGPLPPNP